MVARPSPTLGGACLARAARALLCGLVLAGCGQTPGGWTDPPDGPPAIQPQPLRIELAGVDREPVLGRGAPGSWDAVDVLNPSVLRFRDRLYNFYSGFDGRRWHTGLATSIDGRHWVRHPGNPLLSPGAPDWATDYIAANGAAVVWQGRLLYFYQGRDAQGRTAIGLATSDDGEHFRRRPRPVLAAGPAGGWDAVAVADPYVIARGDWLHLYYLGEDALGVQRLGVARSRDGVAWQRSAANPVLDVGAHGSFDESGLGEPAVVHSPPYFVMFYTGRDALERRDLGYALSTDGVHWKKMSSSGLLAGADRPDWMAEVICDPTLLPGTGGRWRLWFGGGRRRSPDENLDGQIGLAEVDLAFRPDPSGFDVEADWSASRARSRDVLVGSYDIEGESGRRQAWVGPRARITLVARSRQRDQTLHVHGWMPAAMASRQLGRPGATRLELRANGRLLRGGSFDTDTPFDWAIPPSELAPLFDADGMLDLELRADRSFVPADHGGADRRRLAYMLRRIGFE